MASDSTPFSPIPASFDLPNIDQTIMEFWSAGDVFAKSIERTADGPKWVFYEGPPTANGTPGIHHVEARVFKDVFPRYKTMQGYSVPRQAGWDCHGLPVELAVEKELGFKGKPDIERFGIAAFNERCRESVFRHVHQFEQLTKRMGYWINLDQPYETMSPEYVDSVWWSLKRIFDDGRLTEDYRVAPYCTRCGTTLSDHEVAQGYETVSDPSVYVRFPLVEALRGYANVDLLIWTTTPWTLVSNTAVAVNPNITYVIARTDDGTFVVAEPLVGAVLGDSATVLDRVAGSDLAGLRYQRPFELVDIPDAHIIVLADYVSTTDGTGLVHQAPAFGAEDLLVCRANALPIVNPVAPNGRFLDEVPVVGGMFFKDADAVLIEALRAEHRLFSAEQFEHAYPHCWRCHNPLMYYAQLSWYIRTTAVIDALKRENERTKWFPDHIKHGRFGDWLDNNIDWALSRSRYWGTPLPLWRCLNAHVTAIGSRAELGQLAERDLTDLDPHRPFIDAITFDCPQCGTTATRLPEVIDAWYDSGSMPFASRGYPYAPGSEETFADTFPAQYICEALDQTRGWFYTLMAVNTLLFDRSAYENVVCLGLIMAEDGRKMSKHLGNIIEPIPFMNTYGADPLRWFMLCAGSPWSARLIGSGPIEEITRKVLATYWNSASFFTLYASHSAWSPEAVRPVAERHVLDRWILAELHALTRSVTEKLDSYDTAGAGRVLSEFLDDLSNWYIRRSRKRFWAGDQDALSSLHECVDVITRLLAPFVPFITERLWQDVIRLGDPQAPESVHLSQWPQPDPMAADEPLREQMRVARVLAEAGRAARKHSKVRVRQPLGRALIGVPGDASVAPDLLADIADELNVKELQDMATVSDIVLDLTVKPNFRELGKRFGKRTQKVADAVLAADPRNLVDRLGSTGTAQVVVGDETVDLHGPELVVTEVPRSGWVVESQRGVTIALDTTVTDKLAAEGMARDVVRAVQQARKDAGLDISDRIRLVIGVSADAADRLAEHRAFIADETLATSFEFTTNEVSGVPAAVGSGVDIVVDLTRA